MMKKSIIILILLAVVFTLVFSTYPGFAASIHQADQKKVILVQGSTTFKTAELTDANITAWQSLCPYLSGVIFHNGGTEDNQKVAFDNVRWSDTDVKMSLLQSIGSKVTTFTDNFLTVSGFARSNDPDYYNDALWTNVTANMTLFAQAAKAAKCRGINFDPEVYSQTYRNPWYYIDPNNPNDNYFAGKTFNEVKQKVRQRGVEFINALEAGYPGLTVFTQFTYDGAYAYARTKGAFTDPGLGNYKYALLPAFVDGMIDGANPDTIIVSGNESSFYLDESRKYVENGYDPVNHNEEMGDYDDARNLAPAALGDASLTAKRNSQMQIAFTPAIDECYGLWDAISGGTATYKRNWLKHNVYHSLLNTDQYVWIYLEKTDFFGSGSAGGVTMANTRADVSDTINKYRTGQPLGYDMVKTDPATFVWGASTMSTIQTSPTATVTSPASGTFTASGNQTVNVSVNPATNVNKVILYVNGLPAGTDTSAPYSFTYNFLNTNKYTVYARVFLNGTTQHLPHVSTQPVVLVGNTGGSIFTGNQDIGSCNPAGSSAFSNGIYTVNGSGWDIYGTNDACQFNYKQLTGDFTIIAKVESQQNTNVWAKAGVMVRDSLTPGSREQMVAITPGNGITWVHRETTGATSTQNQVTGKSVPIWVKLVRSGNSFSGFYSADGINWTAVSPSRTVAMNSAVYIGLAVTSHSNGTLCTATFSNVSIQ